MAECGYSISWVGYCKKEAEPGSTNCAKHQKLCGMCRKRLVRVECGQTMGAFVCGYETCEECAEHHRH